MTFIYPAVFVPHEHDKGYRAYFPDLECCEADGPDLEDTLENIRDAAYNWIAAELEEDDPEMPEVSHETEITLPAGGFIRQIMVTVKLLPDYD